MYLADYHTHTQFSPDAHDPMTVMAQAALDAGMDEICFTDHVEPLTWGSNELRPPYDWSGLTADFANVQAALGDRIHLRLGMEMGDAQKAPAHMKKLLEDAPQFDFIIGSVHLLSERFGSEDLYLYTPKDQAEAQTALGDYLEEVLALAKLGGFTVLGHLTLPLRYFNEMRGLHTSFDPYEAEIREILKTLIENGRGIELNVNRGNTPLPDAKWLRIYRELGGELITLGTDAHSPEHVGRFIRERQTLLKECGFTRFCTFEKQMPVFYRRAVYTDPASSEKNDYLEEMTMKIALGCDHGGYELKQFIMKTLEKLGYEYEDFGCYSLESCDYPDFGAAAARAVAEGKCDRGIVICTTGIGISIAANKIKGIRCAHCADCLEAEMTRRHNDANMMAIGAGFTGKNMAERMVEVFLTTEFEGGRHERRVNKMMALEQE